MRKPSFTMIWTISKIISQMNSETFSLMKSTDWKSLTWWSKRPNSKKDWKFSILNEWRHETISQEYSLRTKIFRNKELWWIKIWWPKLQKDYMKFKNLRSTLWIESQQMTFILVFLNQLLKQAFLLKMTLKCIKFKAWKKLIIMKSWILTIEKLKSIMK